MHIKPSDGHALLIVVTDRAPRGVCSLQLWPWARTRLCWCRRKDYLTASSLFLSLSLSLSLLTCPTCLQSTIALSFGPHRRGCSRESHIQRATEKQGQQIGTRGYSEAATVLVCEAFNWRVVKTSVWQGIIESLFEPSSCCSYSKYAHLSIQSHYSEINLSHHTQVRHPARYISILKADGWCTRLVKRRASAYSGAERRKNKMHYSILSQDTNKCRGSPAAS